MVIGAHLSASKGFTHMLDEALSIGANTFQFFTRNPRGGKAKDLDEQDIKTFLQKAQEVNYSYNFIKLFKNAIKVVYNIIASLMHMAGIKAYTHFILELRNNCLNSTLRGYFLRAVH